MKFKSNSKKVSFLFLFVAITSLFGMSTHRAWADPIDDAMSEKADEFALKTQEPLYRGFVDFVFKKYCSSDYPAALEKMRELNAEEPLDAWVAQLGARRESFLNLFANCSDLKLVLSLCDQFVLKIDSFIKETLTLAEMILRDPDRNGSLKDRMPDVDAFIQADIERDYTPEKLLLRLEPLAKSGLQGPEPTASEEDEEETQLEYQCGAQGCTTRILSPDLNPFTCTLCDGNYCGDHRLLKAHDCSSLKK